MSDQEADQYPKVVGSNSLYPIVSDHGIIIAYGFWCPGCNSHHAFLLPRWDFNENFDSPTFSPSLSIDASKHDFEMRRCHLYLRDGVLEFLPDCTHHLAGKKVALAPEPKLPKSKEEE